MKLMYVLLLTTLVGCYREENKRFLEQQGFKDVELCGYAWFSCGRDDEFATCFTATNPAGNQIKGAVCEGLIFKNKTIRFE